MTSWFLNSYANAKEKQSRRTKILNVKLGNETELKCVNRPLLPIYNKDHAQGQRGKDGLFHT